MSSRNLLVTFVFHGCVVWLAKCVAVVDFSFSFPFACAKSEDGALKCWGDIRYLGLELGVGVPFEEWDVGDGPNEMGVFLPEVDLGTNRTVKKLASGSGLTHMCAVLDNGGVKCWGLGSRGVLGGPNGFVGNMPGQMGDALPEVDLGTNRTAVQVATGYYHTCAVLDNGDVKCWGLADDGRLGVADPSGNGIGEVPGEMGDNLLPVNLGTNRTALQVDCGQMHTCALLENHQIKCWGKGLRGQLGSEDSASIGEFPSQMGDNLKEVDLGTNRSAVQISCGYEHTCALLDNGQVKCWGQGHPGVLGNGRKAPNFVGNDENEMGDNLAPVDLGEGVTALQVSAGSRHTCVVLSNHQLKCFGSNSFGNLGLEDTESRGDDAYEMGDNLTAVNVGENRSVIAVRTGTSRTCVILDDGTLKCWGSNRDGRLGYGDKVDRGGLPGSMGDSLPAVDLSFGIPAPTSSPSTSPTLSPTKFPSTSPSDFPTSSPVVSPTLTPTSNPVASQDNAASADLGIGIVIGGFVAFALLVLVRNRYRKSYSSQEMDDGSNIQPQEDVRQQWRSPQFALAVSRKENREFPVAKVVRPSI